MHPKLAEIVAESDQWIRQRRRTLFVNFCLAIINSGLALDTLLEIYVKVSFFHIITLIVQILAVIAGVIVIRILRRRIKQTEDLKRDTIRIATAKNISQIDLLMDQFEAHLKNL